MTQPTVGISDPATRAALAGHPLLGAFASHVDDFEENGVVFGDDDDDDIVTEMLKKKWKKELDDMKKLIAVLAGKNVAKTTCKDCMLNILGAGVGSPGNVFCAAVVKGGFPIVGCIAAMKAQKQEVCEALFPDTKCK